MWRTFRLLSQRASGLRAVQELWRAYRAQAPQLWGVAPALGAPEALGGDSAGVPESPGLAPPRQTGWRALDFLDGRSPAGFDGALLDGTIDVRPRSLWDGRTSHGWWDPDGLWDADLLETMVRCRDRVAAEMDLLIPQRSPKTALYDLMRSYPARQGKGLRPTLTIAACAALRRTRRGRRTRRRRTRAVPQRLPRARRHRRRVDPPQRSADAARAARGGARGQRRRRPQPAGHRRGPLQPRHSRSRPDPGAHPRGAAHVPRDRGGAGAGAGVDPPPYRAGDRRRVLPHEHEEDRLVHVHLAVPAWGGVRRGDGPGAPGRAQRVVPVDRHRLPDPGRRAQPRRERRRCTARSPSATCWRASGPSC